MFCTIREMKKNELKIMIRKIVREEVAMTIQEVISELKQPTNVPNQESKKKKIISKNKYTNNSVLNEVLNETANSNDEWETLGGKTFSTDNMNDVLSKSYSIGNGKLSDKQMIESMGVTPESIPDNVAAALTKDYSKLMNTILNKGKD